MRWKIVAAVALALFTAFQLIDSGSYLITGQSLFANFFGGGSAVSEAVKAAIPGMSPAQFVLICTVVLIVLACIFCWSLYYTLYSQGKLRGD